MDNRVNILKELHEISPIVEQMGPLNPYLVPKDYFEQLPLIILNRVKNGEGKLLTQVTENPYAVPDNYFESFASKMLQLVRKEDVSDPAVELQALSPLLAGLERKNPFSVPDYYFEDFASNVTDGAKAIDEAHQALMAPASILSVLKDKNVYAVPADYFETLPGEILAIAKGGRGQAKVVKGKFAGNLRRLAVAAILIGIVAVSALLFLNNNGAATNSLAGIDSISVDALESFVNNQVAFYPEATAIPAADADLQAEDVKEFLAEFSDSVLQQYAISYTDQKVDLN